MLMLQLRVNSISRLNTWGFANLHRMLFRSAPPKSSALLGAAKERRSESIKCWGCGVSAILGTAVTHFDSDSP